MQRPKIDKTPHHRRVRKHAVQVGDAILRSDTHLYPKSGVPYHRVTNVDGTGAKRKVFGYYIGTKKREDSGKPSKDITELWEKNNPWLLERTEPEQKKQKKAEPEQPAPELPANPKLEILITKNDGETVVQLVQPGQDSLLARDDHPNFKAIWAKVCANDDDGLADLFNIPKSVEIKFQRLSERVAIRNGVIYLDNDPMDNALTKQILKFLDEGREDWGPLVTFFEKVQANLSQNSRTQMFEWLNRYDVELTDQGDFLAYKKVRDDGLSDAAGHAFVDGKEYNGRIPNPVGSIVEMPRSEVVDNPHSACSVGLHVATERFAQGYLGGGGKLLKLLINPRDVVSVPNSSEKVRVCRYRVLEEVPRS